MSEPSNIYYEVMVDWNATDWAAAPDFSEEIDDISLDVQDIPSDFRGTNKESGNAPAATFEIKLIPGLIDKYSPFSTSSPLYGLIRPWLPIRIRAIYLEITYDVFTGFISRIHINPDPDVEEVYFYITDGSDLLARQKVAQDFDTRTQMSDGEAVGKLLDAGGWSADKRILDTSGGQTLNYPLVGAY